MAGEVHNLKLVTRPPEADWLTADNHANRHYLYPRSVSN